MKEKYMRKRMSNNKPAIAIKCHLWTDGDDGNIDGYFYKIIAPRCGDGEPVEIILPRSTSADPRNLYKRLLDAGVANVPHKDELPEMFKAAGSSDIAGHIVNRPGWHGPTYVAYGGSAKTEMNGKPIDLLHAPNGQSVYLGKTEVVAGIRTSC